MNNNHTSIKGIKNGIREFRTRDKDSNLYYSCGGSCKCMFVIGIASNLLENL